jgi:hypothetical protein
MPPGAGPTPGDLPRADAPGIGDGVRIEGRQGRADIGLAGLLAVDALEKRPRRRDITTFQVDEPEPVPCRPGLPGVEADRVEIGDDVLVGDLTATPTQQTSVVRGLRVLRVDGERRGEHGLGLGRPVQVKEGQSPVVVLVTKQVGRLRLLARIPLAGHLPVDLGELGDDLRHGRRPGRGFVGQAAIQQTAIQQAAIQQIRQAGRDRREVGITSAPLADRREHLARCGADRPADPAGEHLQH